MAVRASARRWGINNLAALADYPGRVGGAKDPLAGRTADRPTAVRRLLRDRTGGWLELWSRWKRAAERKNGHYIVNGSKTFISNANRANFYTVFAVTEPGARHRGISCFIIEKDSPGVSVSRHFDKMGQRAADTAEITFENVEVPAENRLGEEGAGFIPGDEGVR